MSTRVVELQGATRAYQLDCASTNAMCRLEALTDRAYASVLKELRGRKKPRSITVRAFLAAMLVDPPQPSLDAVGPILKDIGGVAVIRKAVRSACRR